MKRLLLTALTLACAPAWAQHAGHDHDPHAGHGTAHAATPASTPADATTATAKHPLPPVSDADRAAAFPQVHDHHKHGTAIHSYWLLDRLEVVQGAHGNDRALVWEGTAWIGGDIDKVWLRSEGAHADGQTAGNLEILYGRGISAWWDAVAGIKQELGTGPQHTWLAVGVQGLAPYKFEMSATTYVRNGGHAALKVEAEYDTLLTNRLILQWRAEANARSKSDPLIGQAAGLTGIHAGARLRYEVHRQFAPYVGWEYERALSGTADLKRHAAEPVGQGHWVAGVRVWF